jgi:hypothetical protein
MAAREVAGDGLSAPAKPESQEGDPRPAPQGWQTATVHFLNQVGVSTWATLVNDP